MSKKVRTNIRITELLALTQAMVTEYKALADTLTEAFLKATVEKMDAMTAQATEALKKSKTRSRLEEADGERDEAFRAVYTLVSGYTVFPIAAKKEAALLLKKTLDKYGLSAVTEASYAGESTYLNSLFGDLEKSDAAAAIKALDGVADVVQALREKQAAFEAALSAYATSRADEAGDSASSFKKPLLSLVNDTLLPYLDVQLMTGQEACRAFSERISKLIADANEVVLRRANAAKSAKAAADAAE